MTAEEYCVRVFDGTHDTPKPVDEGKLLITSKNISSGDLDFTDAYFISEEDYKEVNKRSQVQQWDILFSMIGTVGNVYIEENQEISYAIKNMGVFSCQDEYKAKWLYYYLQSPYFKKLLNHQLSGAIQKFAPLGWLRSIDVPEFTEDKKIIVDKLQAIDKKIALNRRMNASIEKMAKELYDYWFVQFDFPDSDGKPYKSSGGSMVYNECLKREIPEGWECKQVKDLIEPIERGISYSSEDLLDPEAMPMISLVNFDKKGEYRNEEIKTFSGDYSESQTVSEFDMLIASTDMTRNADIIGTPIFVTSEFEKALFTMDLVKITPNNLVKKAYIYYTLKTDFYHNYIKPFASGTNVMHLNVQGVLDYTLSLPDAVIQTKFENVIKPFKKLQFKNINEIKKLTSLRNYLLPMLMNNQAKII